MKGNQVLKFGLANSKVSLPTATPFSLLRHHSPSTGYKKCRWEWFWVTINYPDKNASEIIFEMSEQKMYRFCRMKNLPSCDCTIKALQETKDAKCVLEKLQMSSGNAQRALGFRAETVLLPEPWPYKAKARPWLPQLNQPNTHCLFP